MASLSIGDVDSAIRVVVTPSQSSYFADIGTSRSHSRTHKRGAHSVSLAPIAQPPTSSGNPKTPTSAAPSYTRFSEAKLTRKGLVGKHENETNGSPALPELIEQRRKKLLAKSLSVSVSPADLEHTLGEGSLAKSAIIQRSNTDPVMKSLTSPKVPSPLSRSHTPFFLASNHPHARKQSVLDGQETVIETQTHLKSPTSMPSSPTTPNASHSTLTLDPISESSVYPYPPTPSASSPRIESPPTPSTVPGFGHDMISHAYPPKKHARHQSQIGLGLPPSGSLKPELKEPLRTAFSSSFSQSNAELILYSYAQLSGTLTITPLPGSYAVPDQAYALNVLRSTLLRQKIIGGGNMDILSSVTSPPVQRRHSRSSSLSSSFFSLLSPTSLTSSVSTPSTSSAVPRSPGRGRTSSVSYPNGNVPRFLSDEVDTEAPLPVFDVQPTMLAVDMSLLPGESRTYTYTVPLPENLPPTYRGRTLRFSYELIIGTCRAGSGPGGSGPVSSNSISRVMRVPIRVYTNVAVGRAQIPYDLLSPATRKRSNEANGAAIEMPSHVAKAQSSTHTRIPSSSGTLDDLKQYARQLMATNNGVTSSNEMESESWSREDSYRDHGPIVPSGCREAVEILTRNMKRASYDVNKDGVKVAVLTFVKSSYRLGETVLGVVELNEHSSRSRVIHLSAILETQESFPISTVGSSEARHLRRVHAEHHSSFALSSLRTTFALDIPSDASPAFQIQLGPGLTSAASTFGGLEWKVRLKLSVAVASESSDPGTEGARFKSLTRDGPRGEWGSSWRAYPGVSPKEKPLSSSDPNYRATNLRTPRSWASVLANSLLGSAENRYHDGDEEEDLDEVGVYDGIKANMDGGVGTGVNYGGGEHGWADIKIETVECEVPVKVWPGNTVFKATDVVFDV